MRKLGEQWIEELDGKKHMLKAVTPIINGHPDIKDLGILNEDGLLPCPFCGEYPEIQGGGLSRAEGYLVFCDGTSHGVTAGAFIAKQEAINEWNRRA